MESLTFESEFLNLCQSYADTKDTFETTGKPIKHGVSFSILRRVIKLELLYLRSSFGDVRNVIYCRVYPNKAVKPYYLLPELFLELGIGEFRSCFFAEITAEEQLQSCFSQLTTLIDDHLAEIESAAEEGTIPLEQNESEADYPEHRLMFTEYPEFRDRFVIYNYTLSPAYLALLSGDRKKAVRLYEKAKRKGRTYAYQDLLCEYLKSCDDRFTPMPDACNGVKTEKMLKKRAVPIYLASIACLYAAFSVFFLLLRGVFLLVFTKSCAAYFSSPWYDFFLLAGLPALFGFFALRKPLAALLSRTYGQALNRVDRLKNSRLLDRITAVLFAATLIVSLFFFSQIYGYTVRIFPDRLDFAAGGSILHREEIRFDEIREICHVSARYNIYGDRIERPSYVIAAKDGRHFDLDSSSTEKECEKILLPMLAEWNVPVTQADTERDLP